MAGPAGPNGYKALEINCNKKYDKRILYQTA